MRGSKWANRLAVRLTDAIVKALKLRRDARRDRALVQLRELKKPIPNGFCFDRGEANTR
jgi:antitoxin MazE